jgi:hypothetical protein
MKMLVHLCFELSTLYTIFLLILFTLRKNCLIPLTFRTACYDWGGLRTLITNQTIPPSWCPEGVILPQCSCINDNLNRTFEEVLDKCLYMRTTWKKSTCPNCQVHLCIPILVASLTMCLFFSRLTFYKFAFCRHLSYYLPILLALCVIIFALVDEGIGAIPTVLTILSSFFEMLFSSCLDEVRVYWSFQRFFMGSIAVWVAVTHQSRDIYVVSAYALLGFFIGMLAYCENVMYQTKRMNIASIYIWVAICVTSACLTLLVQQHWYSGSPVMSSLISVVCLFFTCLQCILVKLPDTLQLFTGLFLLSVSVLTVAWDVLN